MRIGRVSEWRDRVRQAERAKAEAEQRVGDVEAQVADIKGLLASAERDRADAVQQLTALEHERDGLRSQLGDVTARLQEVQAANRQLAHQLGEMREAAATATDLARRNLIAVEDRVRQLNGTLEVIEPAGGRLEPDPARSGLPAEPPSDWRNGQRQFFVNVDRERHGCVAGGCWPRTGHHRGRVDRGRCRPGQIGQYARCSPVT